MTGVQTCALPISNVQALTQRLNGPGGAETWHLINERSLALLPEVLAGPWLLANAAVCAWLGWAAAQPD